MTDLPDTKHLRAVAEGATPGPYEAWSSIYEGMKAAVVSPGHDPLKTVAEIRTSYGDAVYFATFDPPTVLSLLDRIQALEGERDHLKGECENAQKYMRVETNLAVQAEARAEAAEARALALEGALRRSAAWFRDYARQHRAKGTPEGMLKADTNDERADFCEALLPQQKEAEA